MQSMMHARIIAGLVVGGCLCIARPANAQKSDDAGDAAGPAGVIVFPTIAGAPPPTSRPSQAVVAAALAPALGRLHDAVVKSAASVGALEAAEKALEASNAANKLARQQAKAAAEAAWKAATADERTAQAQLEALLKNLSAPPSVAIPTLSQWQKARVDEALERTRELAKAVDPTGTAKADAATELANRRAEQGALERLLASPPRPQTTDAELVGAMAGALAQAAKSFDEVARGAEALLKSAEGEVADAPWLPDVRAAVVLRNATIAAYKQAAAAVREMMATLDAKQAAATTSAASADTGTTTTPAAAAQAAEIASGRLEWSLVASLLEFRVVREESEPARNRDYTGKLTVVPPAIGVQFTYQPATAPWRLRKNGKGFLQLISAGGFVLARFDSGNAERGALSLGGTLSFFNNFVGVGLGFDLYRGIAVRGADGVSGSDTVGTGILAWALSPKGQVTPENVFVTLTLGLNPIVDALGGKVKE